MPTSLSILMPVYNERATLEQAVEDALSAALPGRVAPARDRRRRLNGRYARALAGDNVARGRHGRLPRAESREGCRAADGHPTCDGGPRGDPRCRPRVPRCGSRSPPPAPARRRGARGLRHSLLVEPLRVQLLVRGGQQGRHDGDERHLQLLDLGRDDLPQGDEHRAISLVEATRAGILDRAGDRCPRASARASGSTRCRSRTRRARARRERSSPRSMACGCCGPSFAAASSEERHSPPRRRRRAFRTPRAAT